MKAATLFTKTKFNFNDMKSSKYIDVQVINSKGQKVMKSNGQQYTERVYEDSPLYETAKSQGYLQIDENR